MLFDLAGKVGSAEYDMFHSKSVLNMLPDSAAVGFFESGGGSKQDVQLKLSPSNAERPGECSSASADHPSTFLNGGKQLVRLASRTFISPRVVHLRFDLPAASTALGLPVGKHVRFHAPRPGGSIEGLWNGVDDAEAGMDEVERKMTPAVLPTEDGAIGPLERPGSFDLVVRVFAAGEPPEFTDGGRLSQYIGQTLPVGESIPISGPMGLHEYIGSLSLIHISSPRDS